MAFYILVAQTLSACYIGIKFSSTGIYHLSIAATVSAAQVVEFELEATRFNWHVTRNDNNSAGEECTGKKGEL